MPDTTVNALDFLPAALRASVVDGTCTQDVGPYLRDAARSAATGGGTLHLPTGLWPISATDSSASGWIIDVPDHRALAIIGDGPGTVLQRLPVDLPNKLMPMVRVMANIGARVRFEHLCFDGNETRCSYVAVAVGTGDGEMSTFAYTPPPEPSLWSVTLLQNGVESIQTRGAARKSTSGPDTIVFHVPPPAGAQVRLAKPYAQEHAANLAFAHGTGVPERLSLQGVTMRACIGDGLWINTPIRNLDVDGFASSGRTRRTRSDITLSYVPQVLTQVFNFEGDAFEVESKVEPPPDHVIQLGHMVVRGAFDLGTETGHLRVSASDIVHHGLFGVGLPMANFYRVRGEFRNCHFTAALPIYLGDLVFNGGSFRLIGRHEVAGKLDEAAALAVLPQNQVALDRVTLEVVAGFPGAPIPSAGHYVQANGALDDSSRAVSLRQCTVATPLDHVVFANRCATLAVQGGALSARRAIAYVGHGSGPYLTRVVLHAGSDWRGAALSLGPTFSGPIGIEMRGGFKTSDLLPLLAPSSPKTVAVIQWEGRWQAVHAGNPNGKLAGVPGLDVVDTLSHSRWSYSGGQAFGAKTYVAVP